MSLKETMNSDSNLNKFFIVQISILNLLAVGLLIKELIVFTENEKKQETINNSIELIKKVDYDKLNEIDEKYNRIKSSISSENTLGNLLEFMETKTSNFNLSIQDTKVISVSNEEIYFDITVSGSFQNIAEFIKEIEEDTNIKEIIKTEITIIENIPSVKISIRNLIL
jgi:hypothetical protein